MVTSVETTRPTFPTLENPPYPKLSYGLPFPETCTKHVDNTFNAKRAYIIASKTLSEKTNFLAQLKEALGPRLVGIWIGIPSHTPINSLLPIIQDIREKEADCLITLGGGSLSDGGKLITFALANDANTIEDIMSLTKIGDTGEYPASSGKDKAPEIPLICIPISLSGGEYSCYSGVTETTTNFKYQFYHEKLYPSLVILDGNLTRSTPMSAWLASGVRSVDHCVEGYLSSNAKDEGDKAALEALPQLVNGLIKTKRDPDDMEARLQSQLGSNLSMTLLQLRVMKGASHGIGHQLGPLGVAHGETSCILLPAVCKFNAEVNGERQKNLKDLLCGQDAVAAILINSGVDKEKADLGDALRAIFDHLGMPKSLKDVGVGKDKLDALAQGCLKEIFVMSNPKPMKTKEDVLQVLDMVLE